MTGLLDELRAKWNRALASPAGAREWRAIAIAGASPVGLLAAIRNNDGRIGILIETTLRHAPRRRVRFQAEGISLIDERSTAEGLLRLAVTLERADLRDIYEILVLDLISVASAAPSPDLAIQHTIRRLEAWQVCLQVRRRGLTREEQAGLLGELAVLELLQVEISVPAAIAAWRGPLGGIHDFQAAGTALEVKATIGLSQDIRISRLQQLDFTGLQALALVRARFQEGQGGMTLPEVIANLRQKIDKESPGAAPEFTDKLMRTGYLDADAEIYGATRTILHHMQGFRVTGDFPRLTAATVPPAIMDAAYSLDERQLGPFCLSHDELRRLMRSMSGLPHE
jgi:hypothetical protein